MKPRILVLITALFLLAGCSAPVVDTPTCSEESPAAQEPPTDALCETAEPGTASAGPEQEPESRSGQIVKTTREDAGLDTIPWHDLRGMDIDSEILRLAENIAEYSDTHMADGLSVFMNHKARGREDDQDCVVVSERYLQPVIGDVRVGDSKQDIIEALGEPSLQGTAGEGAYWTIFYKTETVYLGFLGRATEQITCCAAVKSVIPVDYPGNLLEQILEKAAAGDATGYLSLEPEDTAGAFFYSDSHIHGDGGYYYQSRHGLDVWFGYSEKWITVYNNYAGELYAPEPPERQRQYHLEFVNEDQNVTEASLQMVKEVELDEAGTPLSQRYTYYDDDDFTYIRDREHRRGERYCYGTVLFELQDTGYVVMQETQYTWRNYIQHLSELGVEDAGEVVYSTQLGIRQSEEESPIHFRIVGAGENAVVIWHIPLDLYYVASYRMDADGQLQFHLLSTYEDFPDQYRL